MADTPGKRTRQDPKGLIYEAYRIDAITASQCRSIFFDWALSLDDGQSATAVIGELLEHYGATAPDHPMSAVLRQGLTRMTNPRRRGGWRARARN